MLSILPPLEEISRLVLSAWGIMPCRECEFNIYCVSVIDLSCVQKLASVLKCFRQDVFLWLLKLDQIKKTGESIQLWRQELISFLLWEKQTPIT